MKRLILMFLALLLIITPACSAKSIDEARQTLAQLKLNFDDQQFLEAIRKKDNYAVSLFLDAGMNSNLVTGNSTSPLKIAAIFGNLDAVKLLLSREGVNVDWRDYGGRTAADVAFLFDSNDIVSVLKEKGGTQSATRQFTLTPAQISQALTLGESSAAEKKDIVFVEKDTEGKTQSQAFWVSPFCVLANEKLTASKRYENLEPERLRILANTCQARIIISVAPAHANQNYGEGLKIVGIQNGKILHPYWLDSVPMQQTKTTIMFIPVITYKIGVIAYFNAHDIDITKPIEIKAITKTSNELAFKFTNENGTNPVYGKAEAGRFNWQ